MPFLLDLISNVLAMSNFNCKEPSLFTNKYAITEKFNMLVNHKYRSTLGSITKEKISKNLI